MMPRRLGVGIIGMGGFAREHHRVIRELEAEGDCTLVCTCEPRPDEFAALMDAWEPGRRGVAVYSDYREMLRARRHELQVVTVATPIHPHAAMHRECVDAGIACYLEKPPTLDRAELDEMIAVDAGAEKRTQVGFNLIVEGARRALKQRLAAGEFGAVRMALLHAHVPRGSAYYARADWAGRLVVDDRMVLDSCIGNAVSHQVMALLYWAGLHDRRPYGDIDSVEAELYRAHDIEGMDTAFVRATCCNGTALRVAATHACDGDHRVRETVVCEQATIVRDNDGPFRVAWQDGRVEIAEVAERDQLRCNLSGFLRYVRGDDERPFITLDDTRSFVEFSGLVYVADGQIATVPAPYARSVLADGPGETVAIEGIGGAMEALIGGGRLPSEQGPAWAKPGGLATRGDLDRMSEVVRGLVAARAEERTQRA